MRVEARQATEADVPFLVLLGREAIAELTRQRGGTLWSRLGGWTPPSASTFHSRLTDESCLLAVGLIDDTVVGYSVTECELLSDGARLCRLGEIFVLAGARGVGVGEELMELSVAWGRETGCLGIDSMALPGDRTTKNFFERSGFKARSIVVHRSLIS